MRAHFSHGGKSMAHDNLSGPISRDTVPLEWRHKPGDMSDRVAYALTRMLRAFADLFFRKRYGHRAVVLETVAAVPGMVGGMLNHLKSLRRMKDDDGWISTLLEEAENERMHLMTFIAVAKPNWFERLLIITAQGIFFNAFFVLYIVHSRTAHRLVGYFEEEAVVSYTQYLAEIDAGRLPNPEAPETWDALAEQITLPQRELAEQCDAARASCLRCFESMEQVGIVCGVTRECGQ
jgi:ubiquinol oxidase